VPWLSKSILVLTAGLADLADRLRMEARNWGLAGPSPLTHVVGSTPEAGTKTAKSTQSVITAMVHTEESHKPGLAYVTFSNLACKMSVL
jgi:hypothetical protein